MYAIRSYYVAADVKRGELYLKSTTMPVLGVAALVGLAGDVEGRVLFDMSKVTALGVASAMNGEQLATLDELAKATITELANMITAQAVTKLHDLGFKFDLTPPALFTGENMEVSDRITSYNVCYTKLLRQPAARRVRRGCRSRSSL